MNRLSLLNLAAVLSALALGVVLALSAGKSASKRGSPTTPANGGTSRVVDASGVAVPVAQYERIVSVSTLADQVLLEIVERERVLAVAGRSAKVHHQPWRFAGKRRVERLEDLEEVLGLKPDLVLVNAFSNRQRIARLRESGVTVFDLGAMTGVVSLKRAIEQLSQLLGVPERGAALWQRFSTRLAAVAADIPAHERQKGTYVSVFGGKTFGGSTGSSYNDVLTAAGVENVAVEAGYEGFPSYSREQLLTLDPDWIITQRGREQQLCQLEGLQALKACQQKRVVGVADGLISDPGLQMLDAAEAVRRAVYGERAPLP